MKIKRYMAVSMRAALAQVRAEQGPDAVILSSRRVEEGIEVIAAVDYDEALFVGATVRRAPIAVTETGTTPALLPQPAAQPAAKPTVKPTPAIVPHILTQIVPQAAYQVATATSTSTPAPAPAPVQKASTPSVKAPSSMQVRLPDSGFLAMQREVRDLREFLQGELAHRSWNDNRLSAPLQARVLEELTAMDIASDVAATLAARAPLRTTVPDPSYIPLAMLVRHLPVVENLSTVNGGVIALVGPTGAGKTTTIAKLAARWTMQHGPRDLALVSMDGYRIGARDQLMTYARILGAQMSVAIDGRDLAHVLERLKSKKLILIDTAGMGPRDVRLCKQLAALQLGAARARILLTLPAQAEGHALEQIVRSFACVNPAACILTKVDEAASLGAVISTTLRHRLPIAYLCTGQRVPEDLHAAHERKVWLIQVAVKLRARVAARPNGGNPGRNVGGASAHA